MYVFTFSKHLRKVAKGLGQELLDELSAIVRLVPINMSTWVLPQAAKDKSTWHGHWHEGYRLMGDWRLSAQQEFARQEGHRYALQLDDNSFITGPARENLVSLFDREGYVFGAQTALRDAALVLWGLPELARYFLVVNQMRPARLFEHCNPPNITGLYSSLSGRRPDAVKELAGAVALLGEPTDDDGDGDGAAAGGWDRAVYHTNCVLMSLDWWFDPMVQRFIQLCRDSGGHVAYRWNEQGVMSMAAHLFVPGERFVNLSTVFNYVHRVTASEGLQAGGLSP